MQFVSKRSFKMWDYNVSHKQLLIRSPATPEMAGNIDLVFWEVEFVTIPTTFIGIAIVAATNAERELIENKTGERLSSNVFCLETRNLRNFVVAGGFKVLTNELDIFDSTLVYFGIDRPVEWYGDVVCKS